MTQKPYTSLPWRLLRAFGVVYIAVIGIFAIEELQRREKAVEFFQAQENELAAALAALGDGAGERAAQQRKELDTDRGRLKNLRARLNSLILVGARGDGTLSQLMCELIAAKNPAVSCSSSRKWYGDIPAQLTLKRAAENRASGDVFALLVIVAAVGGALIRMYLPGEHEGDSLRRVLRAVGGGTVCYLILAGGSVPFTGQDATAFSSPATGSLLGLVSGMFSTRLFKLLSDMVENWLDKVTPQRTTMVNERDIIPEPVPSSAQPPKT